MKRFLTAILLAVLLFVSSAFAVDRDFSVPLDDLKKWSESVVVEMRGVTILGHSGVHQVKNDCEMHFGASVAQYAGDPEGWVLEPMNLCVEPFFGKKQRSDQDWINFAGSLTNKPVTAYGVPRIWPEHLVGGKPPSNPDHAMELHPLTRLVAGQSKYDFSRFIYAPEGFEGGLSHATALKLLEDLEVFVTASGNEAQIEFDAGRIGNFTALDIRIDKEAISSVPGGHRFQASVHADKNKLLPVALVTVAGSAIDDQVEALRKRKSRYSRIQGLVLFSLDPVALHEAAKESSGGKKVQVKNPIQLILYGKAED